MVEYFAIGVLACCPFALGYLVRAYQHPVQPRAKNGRFTKGK